MSINKNIQIARKFLNYSQKELAEKIGKTESSIKKYESGATNVPLNVLEKIAEVFNISSDTLIGSEYRLKFELLTQDTTKNNNTSDPYSLLLNDVLKEYQAANITKKSTKYEIHHDKPLSQKDKLNNSLIELITYANKNTPVELTERQQDVLFDEIIDYIRYKLYSMGK